MNKSQALLTAILLVAIQSVSAQTPAPPPAPAPVAEYDPASWKPFTSSEGGFAISMPGTPTASTSSEDTAIGRIVMHLYVLTTKLGEYGVSYSDLPVRADDPAVTKAMLDGARDEILANGARQLNENDITVDGIPGRELILEDKGLIVRNLMLFNSGRLYAIALAAPPNVVFNNGKPSSNPSDRTVLYETTCKRFFGSFKFTPRQASASAPEQARDDILDAVTAKTDLYPDADAKKEIDDALKKAAAEHKRVMLIFGGNWCYDCHVLDQALHAGEAGRIVKENYLLVHVDIGEGDKNLDLISKFKATLDKGVPVVTILAADARILYGSINGEFEAARRMMKKDLVAFLNTWKYQSRNRP